MRYIEVLPLVAALLEVGAPSGMDAATVVGAAVLEARLFRGLLGRIDGERIDPRWVRALGSLGGEPTLLHLLAEPRSRLLGAHPAALRRAAIEGILAAPGYTGDEAWLPRLTERAVAGTDLADLRSLADAVSPPVGAVHWDLPALLESATGRSGMSAAEGMAAWLEAGLWRKVVDDRRLDDSEMEAAVEVGLPPAWSTHFPWARCQLAPADITGAGALGGALDLLALLLEPGRLEPRAPAVRRAAALGVLASPRPEADALRGAAAAALEPAAVEARAAELLPALAAQISPTDEQWAPLAGPLARGLAGDWLAQDSGDLGALLVAADWHGDPALEAVKDGLGLLPLKDRAAALLGGIRRLELAGWTAPGWMWEALEDLAELAWPDRGLGIPPEWLYEHLELALPPLAEPGTPVSATLQAVSLLVAFFGPGATAPLAHCLVHRDPLARYTAAYHLIALFQGRAEPGGTPPLAPEARGLDPVEAPEAFAGALADPDPAVWLAAALALAASDHPACEPALERVSAHPEELEALAEELEWARDGWTPWMMYHAALALYGVSTKAG